MVFNKYFRNEKKPGAGEKFENPFSDQSFIFVRGPPKKFGDNVWSQQVQTYIIHTYCTYWVWTFLSWKCEMRIYKCKYQTFKCYIGSIHERRKSTIFRRKGGGVDKNRRLFKGSIKNRRLMTLGVDKNPEKIMMSFINAVPGHRERFFSMAAPQKKRWNGTFSFSNIRAPFKQWEVKYKV